MRSSISATVLVAINASVGLAPAAAQDNYVSFSAGVNFQSDSDNEGAFDGAFTTGEGTTIPGGTTLPDGTAVGWETEFGSGMYGSLALGRRFGAFRGEVEFSGSQSDVDTHAGVEAGGIALDGEDAGVLITGSDNLGVIVGDLVADGQGDISGAYFFANAYYDIATGTAFTPYVGAGIGVGMIDVDYPPSDVTIINDDASAFAYQIMLGGAYAVSDQASLFAGYRYRGTTDIEVDAALFSAEFEVENRSNILEVGFRWGF